MDQVIEPIAELETWAPDPAPMPPIHMLLIQCYDAPATRISIGLFPFTIGRARPANLVLNDRTISRKHCRLEYLGDRVVIVDLGSARGTYLNGFLLQSASALSNGALIRIGGHSLRYWRRNPHQPPKF